MQWLVCIYTHIHSNFLKQIIQFQRITGQEISNNQPNIRSTTTPHTESAPQILTNMPQS